MGPVTHMARIDSNERDLAHIGSMIGQLERLLQCEAPRSAHFVFQPAYWRARIESAAAQTDAQSPIGARASALLAKLDALDGASAQPRAKRKQSIDETTHGL